MRGMKIAAALAIAAELSTPPEIPEQAAVFANVQSQVRSYTNSHLHDIIAKQNARIGIEHFGVPHVEFLMPEDPRHINLRSLRANGEYDQSRDTIHLPLGALVAPTCSYNEMKFMQEQVSDAINVEAVIAHELGHFYLDKLSESWGCGSWPRWPSNESGEWESAENVGIIIVGEGVATYFGKKIADRPEAEVPAWPKDYCAFWEQSTLKYRIGFEFVRPIIDTHGARGIEHLLRNPPTVLDVEHLFAYQGELLRALAIAHADGASRSDAQKTALRAKIWEGDRTNVQNARND